MSIVTIFVELVLFIDREVHHELFICPDWTMSIVQSMSFICKENRLFFLILLLFVDQLFSFIFFLFGLFVQLLM